MKDTAFALTGIVVVAEEHHAEITIEVDTVNPPEVYRVLVDEVSRKAKTEFPDSTLAWCVSGERVSEESAEAVAAYLHRCGVQWFRRV